MTEITEHKLLDGCGFYLDVFGKPKKVKTDQLIPIATRIKFTHQAAVIRWKYDYKIWRLTEPRVEWYPPIAEDDGGLLLGGSSDFWSTPLDKINKNIVVWKQTGIGYVFGFVKRGIGKSVKSSYSPASYYSESEYDPGYFDPIAYIPLYAIKSHLPGVEYFFVPIHCAEVL